MEEVQSIEQVETAQLLEAEEAVLAETPDASEVPDFAGGEEDALADGGSEGQLITTEQENRETGAEVAGLARQAQWLLETQGVDMVEVLRGDAALLSAIARGEMDMHQAYIEHLGRRREDRAGLPNPIRGGSARAVVDVRKLSPEKMREIEERLGRGERIAIE